MLVDDVDIYIGNNVMIAPNVTISPTGHPVHPDLRKGGTQFSVPVRIGDDVWIGSNVVILPGVMIGNNSVIGAGQRGHERYSRECGRCRKPVPSFATDR